MTERERLLGWTVFSVLLNVFQYLWAIYMLCTDEPLWAICVVLVAAAYLSGFIVNHRARMLPLIERDEENRKDRADWWKSEE